LLKIRTTPLIVIGQVAQAVPRGGFEPIMSLVVVEMCGIKERDQDIYVQQGRDHSVSRSLLTGAKDGTFDPRFAGKTRTPFRIRAPPLGPKAVRTRAEIT
jgi:hypothetical protein